MKRTKRKGRWVTTESWTCAHCEGAGSIQWLEGMGEPMECPVCKGEGYRHEAKWVPQDIDPSCD